MLLGACGAFFFNNTPTTENLLAPDAVRRLAWQPPELPSQESIAAELRRYGARDWQIEITAAPIAIALLKLAEKDEA